MSRSIVLNCLVCFGFLVLAAQALTHEIKHVSLTRFSSEFTVIPDAEFSIPIAGSVKKRESKKQLMRVLKRGGGRKGSNTVSLAGSDFDEEYLVNATIGSSKFSLILDTGSSDTWVTMTNFTCINLASEEQPESECAFGPLFNPSSSKTFAQIPDRNFNITYGDGEFLLGIAAQETVAIGGLSVPRQEIGVVTRAAWFGDGINSGLVGLAYPGLTSVFPGTNASADDFPSSTQYSPLPFAAVKKGILKNPFFSIALNRGTFEQESDDSFTPNLGFLSWGGLPPVAVTKTQATAPIQAYNVETFNPSNASGAVDFFYTIDVQAFSFPGAKKSSTFSNNTILDTGTTLNFFPTDVANEFAAAVKPPAIFSDDDGAYIVACNATIPEFHVKIQGKTFTIDPRDNVLPIGTDDDGNEVCILGTTDGGPPVEGNIFILGDTFLHNVVTTFNVKSNEVTITQRSKY